MEATAMADVPESIAVSESGFTLPTSELLTGRGFVTGKSGSGKSVLEGTIVYTANGRKPIEDVRTGEAVLSLNKHDYQQEFRPVQGVIEHEADNLLRITLEDGTQLVGTEDHSFLTVEDLEIVPIRGDELEEGTWFPLARELPTSESVQRIDLAEYVTESRDLDINEDRIRSAQETDDRFLDLDFANGKVLGLYLAEGSFDNKLTLQISNVDDGVKAFLGEHGFNVDERTCNRSFKPFSRFLETEFGRGAGSKSIPNWAFNAPTAFKAGLLSGYFDGDASVGETLTVTSKSAELIADVRELLKHFGVSSTVRDEFTVYKDERRRYRRLRVDAFSLPRLSDVLELSVESKSRSLDRAVRKLDDGDRFNSEDMIPGFGHVLNLAARERGWTKRASERRVEGQSAQLLTRKQKAGRDTCNRLIDDLRVDGRAKKFGRSAIQWKRVVDIEPMEESRTVYDLDVQLNDNFIANGVFVHNSNSVSVIAEELLAHGLPLLIVDTDGEYYGLKSQYELLHVGAEADCDATVGAEHAETLAELALLQNVPVVLDISGYVEEEERRELVRRVVERLFELGKRARKPFPLFVEEVHEFLPQSGGLDELGETLITVAKRGRKRGIGVCGMSQRPAAVDKDFITQCDWIVWHRLTWDNDKRVAGQMLGSDAAAAIDDLADGEALLMTDWDDRVNRVQFRRKRTYDAGATPGLDDLDAGTYSPVRTGLLSELSGEAADLNDVDVEALEGASDAGTDPEPASAEALDAAAEAASAADDGGSDAAELEAAPSDVGGRDVVTVPTRPAHAPPEPTDDEGFDPVWELGHLTAYLVGRTGRAAVDAMSGIVGLAVRAERRVRRDAWRGRRALRRRLLLPTVRELEDVAAHRIPDRLVAVAALVLLAVAILLLFVA
ncbi:MAG: LAGLIDADG family homing endonuclease [Halobacteriales archaeon]